MNYQETLSYLYHTTPVFQRVGGAAYKEGLGNSLALDAYLQRPHSRYRTIHVGGTNGKGSVSHLLAAILQQAGYKTGLYTSPHLLDFRERIRVDGQMIAEDEVVDFVARHRPFFETISPSFFELTMAMAFDCFARRQVDVAVVEVGMGGRLDSTNILSPVLSLITNISLDHTQFLGDTLQQIAREKAGIIKPAVPVVIGEAQGAVRKVFEEKAKEVGAPIFFAEDEANLRRAETLGSGQWLFHADDYPRLVGQLSGLAQEKNARTVLSALRRLQSGFRIPPEAVYEGFARVVELTGLQGRWQVAAHAPKIILDTGHNEAGIRQVVSHLERETFRRLHIVFGAVKDKDIRSLLPLLPANAVYYFTRAQLPRALPEQKLQAMAAAVGRQGNSYPTVKEAVEQARSKASPDDLIFIGGSTFVVGEALAALSLPVS